MCALLQESLFSEIAESSSASSPVCLVSRRALQAKDLGPMTPGGYGLTHCVWCGKPSPCTCSSKTLLECLGSVLTEYGSSNGLAFSSKISGTYSSPSCLVLTISGRPTNENDASLLESEPMEQDQELARPTPRANDAEKRGEFDIENPRNGLPAAVKKYQGTAWPSPRASDAEKGGPNQRGSKGDQMLPSAVHNWSTPTITYLNKKADPEKSRPDGLETQAKNWATPTGRDWRSIHASQETMEHNSRPLSEQVGQFATFSLRDTSSTNGKSPVLQLNPRWELQLMCAPETWFDGVDAPCKPSAMPSSRKSRKSSGEW